VVDTWSGAPDVVRLGARLLAGRVHRYGYVSTAGVYVWGEHVDESSPLVDGDPRAVDGDYAAVKRGAELAVLESFPDAVLARAGLILGPYEDIGRLPWWLGRISEGGRVVAPGRPERPLQYVDARDLATWLLSALADGVTGAVDVIGPSGFATTESLLTACIRVTGSDAELSWIPEAELEAAGAEPWTHLPCWVPESGEFAGFLEADTSLAAATGLRPRPVEETVTDTWAWLQRDGMPGQRADRATHGLPQEIERRLLDSAL
jgi:nucleoside-diphosphate-sugar epimerase